MLECAIPGCCVREKFLRSGTLHLVDVGREGGTTKSMVWLCPSCSRKYAVQTWRETGQQIRLRTRKPMFTMDDITSAYTAVLMPKPA